VQPWRVARILLGACLLASILWTNLPQSSAMSGPMCALACCKGRAPHAAGSCMNGSCHAFLNHSRSHTHRRVTDQEPLCGLPQMTRLEVSTSVRVYQKTRGANSPTDSGVIATTALGQSCQPDCDGCTVGYTNSNRSRNPSALAYAARPRPPSAGNLVGPDSNLIRKLAAICLESAPRGPPPFLL
jgi:hypothetical protein